MVYRSNNILWYLFNVAATTAAISTWLRLYALVLFPLSLRLFMSTLSGSRDHGIIAGQPTDCRQNERTECRHDYVTLSIRPNLTGPGRKKGKMRRKWDTRKVSAVLQPTEGGQTDSRLLSRKCPFQMAVSKSRIDFRSDWAELTCCDLLVSQRQRSSTRRGKCFRSRQTIEVISLVEKRLTQTAKWKKDGWRDSAWYWEKHRRFPILVHACVTIYSYVENLPKHRLTDCWTVHELGEMHSSEKKWLRDILSSPISGLREDFGNFHYFLEVNVMKSSPIPDLCIPPLEKLYYFKKLWGSFQTRPDLYTNLKTYCLLQVCLRYLKILQNLIKTFWDYSRFSETLFRPSLTCVGLLDTLSYFCGRSKVFYTCFRFIKTVPCYF